MNVPGSGSSFDFRRIEPKRPPPKSEPAVRQRPESETRLSLVSAGDSKLSAASSTSRKSSDFSAGPAESKAADETDEASADESIVEDSAEWPEDPGDLASDREADEPSEDAEEQTEEQRQRKGQRLDALENNYRSRFLTLDGLIDRLTATCNFLTQRLDGRFNKP